MTTPVADPGTARDTLNTTTAIYPADVRWYLSNPSASVGFSGNGTPGASLGGWMSVTQVSSTALNDIFTDLTISENDAGQVDYQCVFVANFTGTGWTMKNPKVWIPELFYVPNGAGLKIGMDPAGPLPYQSSTQQAAKITNSLTAPPVVTWYGSSDYYQFGLPVPDLLPNYAVPIWLQRTATNSVAYTPQSLSLQVTFTSDM